MTAKQSSDQATKSVTKALPAKHRTESTNQKDEAPTALTVRGFFVFVGKDEHMSKRTCSINGCAKPHRAKGLCANHYNQTLPNRHKKVQGNCAYCGIEVERSMGGGRKHGLSCSDECRVKLRVPPTCKLPEDHPVMWIGKTSPWPRYGWTKCEWCLKEFSGKSKASRFCSMQCAWTAKDRARGIRPIEDIASEIRQCARCNSDYQSQHTQRVHCSDLCRELDRKDRGVGLYHGWISQAERVMLYERDNYTCWICNKACDTTVDPRTHGDSPTLDHVIPRSKGGSHEHENLRTACRSCNSKRGDSLILTLKELQAQPTQPTLFA